MKGLLSLQSLKRLILFIAIDFLLVVSFVSAGDSSETTGISQKSAAAPQESPRFVLSAGTGFWMPVRDGGLWEPYVTAGLHMDFATYIPRLLLRFSLEGGQLSMDEEHAENNYPLIKKLKLVHTTLSFSYDIPIIKGIFLLRPRIGLSNAMIDTGEFTFKKIFVIMFESENEFGILGGIEPVFLFNRFNVALSANGEILFSGPDPFMSGNISLTAGVAF